MNKRNDKKKMVPIQSGPVNVGYIRASNGCLWVVPGWGKFHPDGLQLGLKNKNLAG